MGRNRAFKFGAAVAALAMSFSSTAVAATSAPRVDPLVSLSVFGTASSASAVCAAGAQAAGAAATAGAVAAAGQAPGAGCVLPVADAPVVAVDTTPVVLAPVAGGVGLGILPVLLGLAAIAGLAAVILGGNDKSSGNLTPVSP